MDINFTIEYLQRVEKETKKTAESCETLSAKEYFLGRSAGLNLAISLLKVHVKDETPWEV